MIHPYHPTDSTQLATFAPGVGDERPFSSIRLHHHLQTIQQTGGNVWVMKVGETAVGYAAISPVPGLPALAALEGCISPVYQRQGFGSRLLQEVVARLAGSPFHQLSCSLSSLETPTAHFLRANHFFLEHTEIILQLSLPNKPAVVLSPLPGLTLRRYHKNQAAQLFRLLYDRVFAGLPWYQPYTLAEVQQTLTDTADLLFLHAEGEPIGFAWLHQTGEIEPIGILPQEQGKGYGRFLLHTALKQLTRRGCPYATLGVWQNNTTALHLYQSIGFHLAETRYYLAYHLG